MQNIRVVCADEENLESCDHLFVNGAKNKIVRLPENVRIVLSAAFFSAFFLSLTHHISSLQCGRGPFARVVRESVSSDQSLPSAILGKYLKRDEPPPLVYDLSLDNNFAEANPTQ